jgi:hypothetical protein
MDPPICSRLSRFYHSPKTMFLFFPEDRPDAEGCLFELRRQQANVLAVAAKTKEDANGRK